LKTILIISGFLFLRVISFAQQEKSDSMSTSSFKVDTTNHYSVKYKEEVPIVAGMIAFDSYNFAQISKIAPLSATYVQGLNKSNVDWFDRWGVRPYSKTIDQQSYIPFYVAIPLPVVVFALDKKMRKDIGKLSFLYVEAMMATGALYSPAAAYANRLRPFVYDPETPLDKRILPDSRKSFFSGHVALVATSVFFTARVLAEYHPESKFKWLYYSLAGTITASTGYMRQAAGEHFLTDILLGTGVGTLSGLLTPSIHKIRIFKNQRLTVLPFGGNGEGFTAIYRF
jgi:membrane-associated phospholipid phosphatase